MPRTPRPTPYAPTRGRFAGRRFRSEYHYRKALATAKGLSSPRASRGRPEPIYTQHALVRLSLEHAAARGRALEALAHMRHGASLRRAAEEAFTDPDTVLRWAGSALRRDVRGRLRPKPRDRLIRAMRVLTTHGYRDLYVADSGTASLIGTHASALAAFARTGRLRGRSRFRRALTVGKVRYYLEIDPLVLRQVLDADTVSFELYPQTA